MIKILCDSMSDIPLDIIKKYNIGIIPLTVIFNNKEYLDGDNLIIAYSIIVLYLHKIK